MKKYVLIFLTIAAVMTFGFITYDSKDNSTNDQINDQIIIKGLEKSGYSESNTASL